MLKFSQPVTILIGIALVLFVIIRQFMTRPDTPTSLLIGAAILAVLGISSLPGTPAVLLAVNGVFATVLGVLRGGTFRLWRDDRGQVLMQATMVTVALWAALILLRVAMVYGEQRLGLLTDVSAASYLIPIAL